MCADLKHLQHNSPDQACGYDLTQGCDGVWPWWNTERLSAVCCRKALDDCARTAKFSGARSRAVQQSARNQLSKCIRSRGAKRVRCNEMVGASFATAQARHVPPALTNAPSYHARRHFNCQQHRSTPHRTKPPSQAQTGRCHEHSSSPPHQHPFTKPSLGLRGAYRPGLERRRAYRSRSQLG